MYPHVLEWQVNTLFFLTLGLHTVLIVILEMR